MDVELDRWAEIMLIKFYPERLFISLFCMPNSLEVIMYSSCLRNGKITFENKMAIVSAATTIIFVNRF